MNPDQPLTPREELELRVTSLLLGELSEAEAASVRAEIAKDPELQKLHDDFKQTIHLVREATVAANDSTPEQAEPLKLSEERRKSLIAAFAIPPLKPEHVKPTARFRVRLIEVFVAVAILAVVISISTPALKSMKTRQAAAMQDDVMLLDAAKHQWALETGKLADAEPTAEELKAYMGRGHSGKLSTPAATEKYGLGKVGEPVVAKLDAKQAKGGRGDYPEKFQVSGQVATVTNAVAFASWMETRQKELKSPSLRGFYDDNYSASPTVAAVTSLPAEPRIAPPPTEIILPKSGALDGDALQVTGTSGVAAGSDFFSEGRSGGGGTSGDDVAGFGLNGNRAGQQFDDGSGKFGPQNRGEESFGRFKNLGDTTPADRSFEVARVELKPDASAPASPGLAGTDSERLRENLTATTASDFSTATFDAPEGRGTTRKTQKGLAELSGASGLAAPEPQAAAPTRQPAKELNEFGTGTDLLAGGAAETPPQVSVRAKFAEVSQNDKRASGFDWYFGNKLNDNTGVAATGGTAPSFAGTPSAANPAAISSGTSHGAQPGSTLNKPGDGTLNFDGAQTFNGGTSVSGGALALSGKANEVKDPVPVLGDMPLVGRLFRSESTVTTAPEPVTIDGKKYEREFVGYDDPGSSVPLAQSGGRGTSAGVPITAAAPVPHYRLKLAEEPKTSGPSNVYSLNAVGYVNAGEVNLAIPTATNAVVADPEWLGMLEKSSKSKEAGNQFVNRYAYTDVPGSKPISQPDSESLARGKRESNIVLPGTPAPAKPGASDKLQPIERQLEQEITQAKAELAAERDKLVVGDSGFGGGFEPAGSLDYAAVQMINAQVLQDEARLDRDEKSFLALTNLSRADQLKALPNIASDPQFNELSQQLNLAQQALIKASKDFGPESSTYISNQKLVDDLTRKRSERVDGVLVGLKTTIESKRAGVESLRSKLAAAKEADVQRATETRPYYDKKRELDSLVSFQKVLEQRLAMEKVDVTLPRTGMVTIMNRAVAPTAADKGILGSIGHALKGDYEATASVKVDRPGADITEFSNRNMSGVYDPYFIQTEFEAIKSEAVLTNVVASLGLTNKWAEKTTGGKPLTMAEATDKLRARLELSPVRNTQFVQIQGKSSDPTEAATIANAVAEAYQQHRLAEIKRASEGGIKALEARFQEQQAKVKKATQELAALREGAKLVVSTNVIDAPLPRKPSTNAPIAQSEIQTSENSFSTFSLNVSDVSFKLAAASLEQGQMPDSASIRSEEFINAFDYRDPEPSVPLLGGDRGGSSPIAFAWERARYPFAHNRDLLRFSLKTAAAGRQAGRPLNIVLLLDNSGSMERADRVGIIREALRVLAKQLQPQDKFSVITFARTPRLVADGIAGDKAGEVAEQVSGLTPEGGTNLEDAMNLAYQTATKHFYVNGINRVVVLTDGAANLGDVEPESLKQKVETNRKQGIALDCFGIGWEGFNDDLLEVLSRNGDGRYGFINSPEEAASEFAGQLAGALKVAASDVKVQVEWNPKRVTSYRQIGYAKHQLTKEQFRDNTVDAAEIAAQEAGNALYTVEVNPTGEGPLATVHVRYKIPGTTDYREQSWDVPFNGNAVSLDQSSAAMRLATTASAFSEWLAVNPFSSEVTPDALLKTISGVPEAFGADPRPKKLEWMIRQAKSLDGK